MAGTLAGCGTSAGATGDVTLKLIAADYGDSAANSSKVYWGDLVKEFEADHPGIDVDVDVYSWNVVDAKVKELVEDGKAPDLAQIGAYADYAADDALYRAGDVLSIATQADFLPQLSRAGQVDMVQYGMPFVSSTRLLFYNKTLFKKAGLTPPQSWSQLQSAAEALKAQGVEYPYALPLGPEEAQAETMMWLLSGGDGYTDQVGGYNLDSEQNIETFTWLKEHLVDNGLTGPVAPGKLNRAEAFAAFTRGEVGMLNGHPTLMGMARSTGVEFGVVTMPGNGGKSKATMGVADWMMAFKQNEHREQIRDFLDFVYNDDNVLKFAREYNLLPVTSSASDLMRQNKADSALVPFLEQLTTSELYPVGKTSWAEVSADIKKQIGKAVGSAGPTAVLGQLQRDAVAAERARE
ncbi:ABC transporter substrate-binding protein [Streptomyces cavernae]|uniref:ABC transporter substrate-binding protein n=1 Tax=Streptomyces cavernae TaxID=2259034 RepID=UPI000FEBDD75|nr:extracellular solute-binding protein [Streptomyces cavernae]